ncbi:hypothetical protein CASFOL_004869 [Castilleja foliolosa]|uniref:HTH La-type RNA-binding domain-containing protein n=1 Tax=Castilleja foliolosa TaxID=1961234 RepID=A0ABD3EC45_9LAMI
MAALYQAQNSPRSRQSRRSSAARGIPSPSDNSSPHHPLSMSSGGVIYQEQIVASSSLPTASDSFKDASTTTVVGSTSFADDGADAHLENSENVDGVKKLAWNKPSGEAIAEVIGAVMGAESWPALSESARASPKFSSTSSLKALSQAPLTVSQEMAIDCLSPPKEVTTGILKPNSNGNHVKPSRQRSMKYGGGSSSHRSMPANDSSSQAPPTQAVVVEAPPPFRRNNSSGPLFQGDGPHHHSVGGRHDQERGKQDWNISHRNFGNRESHAPNRRPGPRPFNRGPAPNAPFIPPQPSPTAIRPFLTPMVYTEMPSPLFYVPGPHPESLRPMPMVPVSPMFFPMPDPYLHSKLVNQIDYYFSNENLVKDTFLRKNMDGEGWVLINLIAGFKKVMELTDNIQLILHAIQASNVVEVKGDKVRRRNDWFKWIMPSVESTITSPMPINKSSQNMLAAHLNRVTPDGTTI